jgi:acyl carrier protein
MADVEHVTRTIKDYVAREFAQGVDDLTTTTNLVEQEIIDSLGIFLLVGFIKETLDVEIEPEDISMENFETIDAIARLVTGR